MHARPASTSCPLRVTHAPQLPAEGDSCSTACMPRKITSIWSAQSCVGVPKPYMALVWYPTDLLPGSASTGCGSKRRAPLSSVCPLAGALHISRSDPPLVAPQPPSPRPLRCPRGFLHCRATADDVVDVVIVRGEPPAAAVPRGAARTVAQAGAPDGCLCCGHWRAAAVAGRRAAAAARGGAAPAVDVAVDASGRVCKRDDHGYRGAAARHAAQAGAAGGAGRAIGA
eukprot:86915-Chlamydomonas_euryale.AAC.1